MPIEKDKDIDSWVTRPRGTKENSASEKGELSNVTSPHFEILEANIRRKTVPSTWGRGRGEAKEAGQGRTGDFLWSIKNVNFVP